MFTCSSRHIWMEQIWMAGTKSTCGGLGESILTYTIDRFYTAESIYSSISLSSQLHIDTNLRRGGCLKRLGYFPKCWQFYSILQTPLINFYKLLLASY